MAVHDLDCHLGERSPLAALYWADAYLLLLGVGFESCTGLHLAEYRMKQPAAERAYTCFVMDRGRRVRLDFLAPEVDDGDFGELGTSLSREPSVRIGQVGGARAVVVPMRAAVDFAIGWMDKHRGTSRP
jgi:aminoglycoside 3-N-acetyltransferase